MTKTEELQSRLEQLEKRKNFAANIKRRKLEEAKEKEEQEAKEKAEKEALRKKYEEMDAEGAMDKILKHIKNPKKFSKCLSLLCNLVEEQFDFLPGDCLFKAFDTVMKCKDKFEQPGDRKLIEKLYFQLVELSSQEVEEVFNLHQTSILDLYYIPVYMQTNLFTDDTFKFNQVLKEMTLMIEDEDMSSYKKDHDKHSE